MPSAPPKMLFDQLSRLGLASPRHLRFATGRISRAARQLPGYDSIWLDALVSSRALTPFQADEVRAGRADSLRIGPFVLLRRAAWPRLMPAFDAMSLATRRPHLLVVLPGLDASMVRLEQWAACCRRLRNEGIAGDICVGQDGEHVWIAAPHTGGQSLRDWSRQRPVPVRLAELLFRQLTEALADVHRAGLVQGDLSPDGIAVTSAGCRLQFPGLITAIGPRSMPAGSESDAYLTSGSLDCLAPEMTIPGATPSMRSDVFGLGCLGWQLFTGKTLRRGGDFLTKLEAVVRCDCPSLRELEPLVPAECADTVQRCLRREPDQRPPSAESLLALLGLMQPGQRAALKTALRQHHGPAWPWLRLPRRMSGRGRRMLIGLASAAACAAALLAWQPWNWPAPRSLATDRGSAASQQPVEAAVEGPVDRTEYEGRRPGARGAPDRAAALESPVILVADGEDFARAIASAAPGQRIAPAGPERLEVRVPAEGVAIGANNLLLERFDFVWENAGMPSDRVPAFLVLEAPALRVLGCGFRTTAGCALQPLAVLLVDGSHSGSSIERGSGQVEMCDCQFRGVGAAVAIRRRRAELVVADNVLHLGPGPLVWIEHPAEGETPLCLRLTHATLRGSGPVVECPTGAAGGGLIRVIADSSVFAPASQEPLVRFFGEFSPGTLEPFNWSGRGSLVTPATMLAAWRHPAAGDHPIEESSLSVSGLVRSAVHFASDSADPPQANLAVHWQAPLPEAGAPGVDPQRLIRGGR